jgi:hypothetical protein
MRGRYVGTLGIVVILGGLAGCTQSGPNLRTPAPEEYSLPPDDDARFSQPIAYPKETLNREPMKATTPGKLPSQQPQIAPGSGAMGRMNPGGF